MLARAFVSQPKPFVYILKSVEHPDAYYVGVTSDLQARLHAHNAGWSPHTSTQRPWRVLVCIEFDEPGARAEVRALLEDRIGAGVRQTALPADRAPGSFNRQRHGEVVASPPTINQANLAAPPAEPLSLAHARPPYPWSYQDLQETLSQPP